MQGLYNALCFITLLFSVITILIVLIGDAFFNALKYVCVTIPNQRIIGPVNAHLLYGPRKSTKHTKHRKNKVKKLPSPSILAYFHLLNEFSASTNFQAIGCNSF